MLWSRRVRGGPQNWCCVCKGIWGILMRSLPKSAIGNKVAARERMEFDASRSQNHVRVVHLLPPVQHKMVRQPSLQKNQRPRKCNIDCEFLSRRGYLRCLAVLGLAWPNQFSKSSNGEPFPNLAKWMSGIKTSGVQPDISRIPNTYAWGTKKLLGRCRMTLNYIFLAVPS